MGGDGFTTTSPRFLLPFAPENTNDWTEEIFAIYHQVQVAIGLRKEPSEEEVKAQELLEEIDEAIDSGENWIDKVREYFGDDDEFDVLIGDEDVVENIARELREAQEYDDEQQ